MKDPAKIRYEIKNRVINFCNTIDSELTVPRKKFLQQMLYGMLSRKSVLLTEIARRLPQKAEFRKIHERLSLNLGKEGWSKILETNLIAKNNRRVKQNTVIALDISDISKKYAKKMENLCAVRDGSASNSSQSKIAQGYWFLEAVGIEKNTKKKFPILSQLYSSESSEFVSENTVILEGFRMLKENFGNKGIYTFDRGGDRGKILYPLLEEGFNFVIRMVGTRNVIALRGEKENRENLTALAINCECNHKTVYWSKRNKKNYLLSYGSLNIRLPFSDKKLTLVVVKGFSDKPMMLLTTKNPRTEKELWKIAKIYLLRWGVEEIIRFKKQTFDLENIRLLKYSSLQNMMVLVNVAVMFLVHMEESSAILSYRLRSLVKHIPKAEETRFSLYRLVDGIREVNGYVTQLLKKSKRQVIPSRQLLLPCVPLLLEGI